MKKLLRDLLFEHEGNRVDKWEQYLGMYEAELARFVERDVPVRLLEIGVQNGGSLELWSKYLPPGSEIQGIDIDSRVRGLAFDASNITVMVADASDRSAIESLLGSETFDVIIDDGSHRSSDIIATFRHLYPHLSPGGKYIIEDLHCSYRGTHEGGYRVGHASLEWLKHLIDALNADHILDDIPAADREVLDSFRTSLARITFYDSAAVVEKLQVEKVRPFRRVQGGRHARVMTDEQWLANEPIEHFNPILFGHPAARTLEPRLIECLAQTRARVRELETALDGARQQMEEQATAHWAALGERAAAHQEALDAALQARDAAHQDVLRAALEARDAQHQHALQSALQDRERAFRDELGPILRGALRVRKAGIGHMRFLCGAAQGSSATLRRWLRLIQPGVSRRRLRQQTALCRTVFDPAWYLQKNPDVAARREDPLVHFLTRGAAEGRDPSPLFDVSWYLERNEDVARAGVNPLVHYLEWGGREGRDPNPLFHSAWYLRRYGDVAAAGMNPLAHYIEHGAAEGRDPNEMFDTGWYRHKNPEVVATGMNPLAHYLLYGAAQGRDPCEWFDTADYVKQNPAAAGQNPLAHYFQNTAWSRRVEDMAYTKEVMKERQLLVLEQPEIKRHVEVMLVRPTFLVVMEPADAAGRETTLSALERQAYPHWTVRDWSPDLFAADPDCVGDDTFIVWLRAGDRLNERALYAFASALNADPSLDLVYADEDRLQNGVRRSSPFFKPDWSPDYLESFNYIGGAACFRSTIAARCWPRQAHRYDFVLRVTEQTARIHHIRQVLCHAATDITMRAPEETEAETRALEGRLARTGRRGTVHAVREGSACYDVRIAPKSTPLISVVIPTAGKVVDIEGRPIDLLMNCLDTIAARSTYTNLEFIIVDNGDLGEKRLEELRRRKCRMITYQEAKFNVAKKLNLGVTLATGEMLLLMNDDIEPLTADWIERLLAQFEKPHVGVAGAKLLYPNGLIQHAGVATNLGSPDHVRRTYPRDDAGYFFSTCAVRNYAAVTGACMMTRADVYRHVGGYSEALAISYNDVDYCLKVRQCGLTVVMVPQAELTHFESQSRKPVLDLAEAEYFHRTWAAMTTSDPFYNEAELGVEPPTFEVRHNQRWL